MQRIVVGGVVAVAFGCAGLPGSETPDAPEAGGDGALPPPPPRVERVGDVVPARVAELTYGSTCRLRQRTVPGDGIVDVGELPGPCPTTAVHFTWSDDRIVVGDEAGVLFEIGRGVIEAPPSPVELAALEGDTLHVCGRVDLKVTRHGNDLEADYEGARLLGYLPGLGEAQVAVHRVYDGKVWAKRSAEIVVKGAGDPPGHPPCRTMSDWPRGRTALSSGPEWRAAAWSRAVPDDESALDALSEGDWSVDASRTVAARGQPGQGPYAAWLAGSWQFVYPGEDASGLWVLEDFLAIRDGSGGFRLLSRRDGVVGFEQSAGTLALPWPDGAPSSTSAGAPGGAPGRGGR